MIFLGKRDTNGTAGVYRVYANNDVQEISPVRSRMVYDHSPTGFEWGYGGSGPAQLALALLLETTDDEELSASLYQSFKNDLIAKMPHECWAIGTGLIEKWIKQQNENTNPEVED